jgi:hypothetical protein
VEAGPVEERVHPDAERLAGEPVRAGEEQEVLADGEV